jgi:hypothetical protein
MAHSTVVATLTWTLLGSTLAHLWVLSTGRIPIKQQLYWLAVGLGGLKQKERPAKLIH